MKKYSILIPAMLLLQFLSLRAVCQPEPIEYSLVGDYFLKPEVKLGTGLNCWAFTSLAQFNKVMTPAKTAKGTVATPKFGAQYLIAVAMPATMRKTTVIIERVEMAGSQLNVHVRVSYGENLTAKMQPLAAATLDRISFIKAFVFYNSDNKVVKTIPVK